MNRKDIIAKDLHLMPLSDEGGYFSETYRSQEKVESEREGSSRSLLTIIYYLMSHDMGGRNYLHSNKSDIVHFFHDGWPVQYITVSPEGKYEEFIVGKDVSKGQVPQLTVKGGYFKAARVMNELKEYETFPGEVPFTLISEAVAPGFDYRDRFVPGLEEVKKLHPNLLQKMEEHIAPDKK
ncbi:uncharacterized protein LOC116306788 [Actinia tenebrosa]|uniref:Uncharacterized protein LOC116306788 n=1 Tax=Actinia tenebrosa TaxID=6105 RepID=A0A6P8IZY1_ACTTE|nr:uncharacterized protein LOC116306788 [Actinia tenebrosa]